MIYLLLYDAEKRLRGAWSFWDDGISRIQVDVDVLVNELMSFSMQDIIELSDVVKDTVSFE